MNAKPTFSQRIDHWPKSKAITVGVLGTTALFWTAHALHPAVGWAVNLGILGGGLWWTYGTPWVVVDEE